MRILDEVPSYRVKKTIKMKTIGFITKHDNHKESKDLEEYLVDNYENINKELILSYLKKGVPCIDWMEWLFDGEGKNEISIGSNGCSTDGIWVWPSYLEYYLNKHQNFKLNQEFLDYIIENQDSNIIVSEEDNIEIQKAYSILTESRIDNGTSILDEDD